MAVPRKKELSSWDRSGISFFLTISILVLSLVAYLKFYDEGGEFDSTLMHGDGGIITLALSVFRFSCAYLVFHSAVFWMIRNPVPGRMAPLFRDDFEIRDYHSTGFERLVPFSSWTMLIFGFAMLWNGAVSFWIFFDGTPSETILHIGTAIFATAFSSAVLTAVIVRYVILPSMMKHREDIQHMFLPHEQVMHNWGLIFLSCEFVFGTMNVRFPMIVLGLTYGALYLIFAELWARYGGGYYVYEFIDPRPPEAPLYLVGLMLVCCASFIIGFFVSFVRDSSVLAAIVLVALLIVLSTRFSLPAKHESNST